MYAPTHPSTPPCWLIVVWQVPVPYVGDRENDEAHRRYKQLLAASLDATLNSLGRQQRAWMEQVKGWRP